jgi:Starch binding domain
MNELSKENSISISFLSTIANDSDISVKSIQFRLKFNVVAHTPFCSDIRILGNIPELGCWDIKKALILSTTKTTYPTWTSSRITLTTTRLPYYFEYKYILFNTTDESLTWENFLENRKICIKQRPSHFFTFETLDTFNAHKILELEISSDSEIYKLFTNAYLMDSSYSQLFELCEILGSTEMTNTVLQLSFYLLKNVKIGNCSFFNKFCQWVMNNLNIQQARVILSSNTYFFADGFCSSEEFLDKLNLYEKTRGSSEDPLVICLKISELRNMIFMDKRYLNEPEFMLIDINLENEQIKLLSKIISDIYKEDIWKIVLVGKWISDIFLFSYINVNQMSTMRSQFRKLEKKVNLNVLKDLLCELQDLVLDLFTDFYNTISHKDCEAFACYLGADYKLIYNDLLMVCSEFILKSIPIVNKSMHRGGFISYSNGTGQGKLVACELKIPTTNKCILALENPSEYINLHENVQGIIAIYTKHLYMPLLIKAREKHLPVVLNYYPPIDTEEFLLVVNEDQCSLIRV